MSTIPKKIFQPIPFVFPRYKDVPLEKYANSQYSKHFRYMKNSSDDKFSHYYRAKICPDIAFHDMLDEMEKEGTLETFIFFFINALPDIFGISPFNIVEILCSHKIVKKNIAHLSSFKLSLLCCRLSSEISFPTLICILQEAVKHIKHSEAHIVASFLFTTLISLSNLIDHQQKMIEANLQDDTIQFNQPFVNIFNKIMIEIIENHIQVLSLRSISYITQEFIPKLDATAPSPQFFIENSYRCPLNTTFTISLILGQTYSSLLNFGEKTKKALTKIFILAPIQTRDAIIYLINKYPDLESSDSFISNIISFNNPLFLIKKKQTFLEISHYESPSKNSLNNCVKKSSKKLEKKSLKSSKKSYDDDDDDSNESIDENKLDSDDSNENYNLHLNNTIYRFLSKFDQRVLHSQSILEIAQILHFIETSVISSEIDPLAILALTVKLLSLFPLFLDNNENQKFWFVSSALCSLMKIGSNLFGQSKHMKIPICHFLDNLLISRFSMIPEIVTFPVEIIENHIKSIDELILSNFEEWFDFILSQPPMFVNIHIISLILKEKSDLVVTYNFLKENIYEIIKQSTLLLQTKSFKALNEISELWIEVVSFFNLFEIEDSIKFSYQTLRIVFDCIMKFRETDEEGCCYFLQLLERIIICPIYHFTLCSFDTLIFNLIPDYQQPNVCSNFTIHPRQNYQEFQRLKKSELMSMLHLKPYVTFQTLRFLNKMLEKNGSNYEINAIFGLPSYLTIFKLARACATYLSKNEYDEITMEAANIISKLCENKYTQGIIHCIIKSIPEGYNFAPIPENVQPTVLELQSVINEIVPNRIQKIELGFKMWKKEFEKGTPIENLIRFAENEIQNVCK
ncbi:hypothetical protein TRFO_23045 [Tritrichomonas foetus]|uniref:Uncharacterized protein n=1 Tax=Tritrichomonas foetus TaxID=1144522 RepID=A0A1J4KB49_9EUKA|nr:hypothetical protein TRFO_23045 [Tritrichomonas foetus]|eukprot:OHT08443.1 hypothetical protein TRFO_23045 [Tritrichomonas foetus]